MLFPEYNTIEAAARGHTRTHSDTLGKRKKVSVAGAVRPVVVLGINGREWEFRLAGYITKLNSYRSESQKMNKYGTANTVCMRCKLLGTDSDVKFSGLN